MKKLILLALVSLFGLSTAWAQTGSLTVTVLGGLDQTPVAGAWVRADGDGHGHNRPHFEGPTDVNGQITFADIPAVEYHVMAGVPPMPPVHGEVEVLEGETATLTLTLPFFEPAPRIAVMPDHDVHFGPVGVGTTFTRMVRVMNLGTLDLNVSIAVTGDAFGLASDAEFTLTPDPMGSNAEVLVTFSPTAIGPYEGLMTITSNDPEHGTIELELDGLGAEIITGGLSVDVVVTDSNGVTTPVDSARVRVSFIRDHGGPRPHHIRGLTDENGNLTIDALPVGIYNVNASKRGVGFASEVIEITEGQTAFVTLSLIPGDGPGGPGHGHHFEIVELAGTVSVSNPDTANPERVLYQLDVDADGVMDYRLNFGPPDYVPPSGAERPANGDAITVTGALMSHGEPPMVHVHTLNGELWWDPRGGRDGEHGGDAGGRAEGFNVENILIWTEVSGTVTDIDVYGSAFYGLDTDNNGTADFVIDLGDNFDLDNPLLPVEGERVTVVGGVLEGAPEALNAEWIIAYEINLNFFRMPGDTDGLNPIDGSTSVTPTPSPIVVSHLVATNYPNPFNPTTNIQFSTPITGLVNLTVFDVLGRQVATLVNENLTAGTYTAQFDAASLPSGMYMYRLTLDNQQIVNRMLLLK